MTTPIGTFPTTSTTPATTAATTSTTTSAKATGDDMDQDMFLKLMVAQLKYQDPSKPTDSSAFLAQTAQFTQVEKMQQLVTAQQSLVTSSQLSSATSLVGSTITYLQSGVDATGVVSGVSISGGVPTLLVGDAKVDLSQVSKVTASPGSTTA